MSRSFTFETWTPLQKENGKELDCGRTEKRQESNQREVKRKLSKDAGM